LGKRLIENCKLKIEKRKFRITPFSIHRN